mgnify:CR=1 FL=1
MADNQITKFYIYDNSDELIETIDSVEKAFKFFSGVDDMEYNEGGYRYRLEKKKWVI